MDKCSDVLVNASAFVGMSSDQRHLQDGVCCNQNSLIWHSENLLVHVMMCTDKAVILCDRLLDSSIFLFS